MKRVLVFLMAALLVVLTACGKKEEMPPVEEPPPVEAPEPLPVPEPEPEPEPYVPAGTNPLTGLPIEPEEMAKRPVAVMLNNIKKAQPQIGISQADVIYEVPAEGGITRMLAVYQSLEGVELLGSVRSTRPYYIELALGHDALLVHAGGSQEAYTDIRKWRVDNMDGVRGGEDAKIFWRDPDRKRNNGYEHSLVTSGEKIQEYLGRSGFELEHPGTYHYLQAFAEDGTPENGETAEQVTVKFSNYKTGLFDYDPASKTYQASQYGEAHVDGGNGQQVSTVNLLVLETSMQILDSEGRLRVQTIKGGDGTYFCGGKAIPIFWERNGRDDPLVYTLQNGRPLAMGKGNSYVCFISPKTGSLSYQ